MTANDIDRVVMMSEAEYLARAASLAADEQRAYHRYCASVRPMPIRPGTPRAIGHGSSVCLLNHGGVQTAWLAAARRLKDFEAARGGWQLLRQGDGVAVYRTTANLSRHCIEVVTHGVDVSDCPTPSEAIVRVRQLLLAA
jgi:hypothetical protein